MLIRRKIDDKDDFNDKNIKMVFFLLRKH